MTKKSRPDDLLDKNAGDFDALTQAIEDALKKIKGDLRLKPTRERLSELAGCSRSTLNNRSWPLTKLDEIICARRTEQAQRLAEQKVSDSGELESESEVKKLQKQLKLNRTDNARLQDKNDELRKELQQARELLAEVTKLTRNTRQDATPSKPKPSAGKVVPLHDKAAALPEPGKSKL